MHTGGGLYTQEGIYTHRKVFMHTGVGFYTQKEVYPQLEVFYTHTKVFIHRRGFIHTGGGLFRLAVIHDGGREIFSFAFCHIFGLFIARCLLAHHHVYAANFVSQTGEVLSISSKVYITISSKTSFSRSAPRKQFVKHRVRYYSNHTACFDSEKPFFVNVHPNPGPITIAKNTKTGQVNKRTPNISFLSLNARSIVNKATELCARLSTNTYHLVAVTETWLDSHIGDSEIFPSNFQIQRRDRSRHGGGVLLACSQDFSFIRRPEFETDCKILWCKVIIPNPSCKILVGVFYRPPSTGEIYLPELGRSLSLIERSGINLTTLLLGDFNLPRINWSTPSPSYCDNLSATL